MSTHLHQARAALKGNPTTGPDASLWAKIGYWAGISVLQLLLVEFVVSATWRGLYSYRNNFVSELGISFCGPAGNWPCSKLYVLMNASIALFGVALIVAVLAWLVTGVLDVRGGALLAVAGGGAFVAGIVNQGVDYQIHSLGATVMFVVGSLGMIVAGGHPTLRVPVRIVVTSLGSLALAASLLYIGGHNIGIGIGVVERTVVYSLLSATVVLAVANRSTARKMASLLETSSPDDGPR
ncbi:DUF998 domain-containing protein [Rhodococcus sp. G-MC3]|uniref:DUF998 domain-containing protein n=1 Tax=Rhodococcus sp. G-MC3 TaxID=3046209 RepID=UPI0024BA7F19|nr:DUF998 domain-containing protein [Rhodococcus sp. G-MC3]MDJ0395270.1 DUF998 domain-containing protein [Rhodococcus sp. G-MC3]